MARRALAVARGAIARIYNSSAALLGRRRAVPNGAGEYALLTGAAVESSALDQLDHAAIACGLAAAIRDTPAESSLGIALYGPWGQGKSTIGALLREQLEEECSSGRYAFIRIDAWKYAHERERQPLRRHFLIAAYEAAGLKRKAAALKRLFNAELTGAISRSRTPLGQGRLRGSWEVALALLIVAAFARFGYVGHRHAVKHWAHILGAAGVLGAVVTVVSSLIWDRARIAARINPFGSVEEYDDQLTRLIEKDARDRDHRPIERLIFFIDDLDRCRDELIVEAIDTLQAFFGRSRCVYIVAADREQLRRAVREQAVPPALGSATRGATVADESFLEKIFQVAVEVPPPLAGTMSVYAHALTTSTHSDADPSVWSEMEPDEREGIVDLLVHPQVASPRQVRVVLNEFTMALNIAHHREAAARVHLGHRPLTVNKRFLAKLTVLRVHFPWFYELLPSRPELLVRAEDRVEMLQLRSAVAPDDVIAWGEIDKAAVLAAGEQLAYLSADESSEEKGEFAPRRQAFIDQLLRDLEGYLSYASDVVARDVLQVEEFIFLRGRKEFEELPGEDGAAYRLAILQGNVDRIDELAKAEPALLPNALRAARAQLRQARGAGSDRVRRALLGLLACAPADVVAVEAADAARALYPDDFTEEAMERDSVAGVRRLIPVMDPRTLKAFVSVFSPDNSDDLFAVAQRSLVVNEPQAWRRALNAVAGNVELLDRLASELPTRLSGEEAKPLLPPSLAGLRPVIESPDEFLDEKVSIGALDLAQDQLTVLRPSGETLPVVVPDELVGAAADHTSGGAIDLVAARRADGTWQAVSLTDINGERLTVSNPPTLISREAREAAFAFIGGLADRGASTPSALSSLLDWDYTTALDRVAAFDLLTAGISRHPDAPIEFAQTCISRAQIARAMVAGTESSDLDQEMIEALANATIRLLAALTSLPANLVRQVAEGIVGVATGLVLHASPQARDELAAGLHSARTSIRRRAVFNLISGLLPDGRRERVALINAIIEPVDPVEALKLYVADMRKIDVERRETEDNAERNALGTELEAYLPRIAPLAHSTRAAPVLSQLPLVPRRRYAGLVMQLIETEGASLQTTQAFLTAAASHDSQSLEATARFLIRTKRTSDEDVDAVLAGHGTATARGEDVASPVLDYQQLVQRRVPRLEQDARIAELVNWKTAEQVGGDQLVRRLLESAAKLIRTDKDRARVRMRLAESWGAATTTRRREAAAGYAKILDRTKTQDQIVEVLDSLHRFFREKEADEKVKLRKAVGAALPRIHGRGPLDDETRNRYYDLLSDLDLLGTASRPLSASARHLLGL